MAAFREAVSSISTSTPPSSAKLTETEEEVTKLKDLVKSLRDELSTSSIETVGLSAYMRLSSGPSVV